MTYRIFISSVQREFAKERKALADHICMDAFRWRCLMCVMLTGLQGICFGANIVGYTTEVTNGKTNVVTVSMEGKQMNNDAQTQQVAQSVTPRQDRPKLHMAELLSYLTVRLSCVRTNGGVSCGTGFFYDIPHIVDKSLHIPVIVSNRHVVENALETIITFTLADTDSFPSSAVHKIRIDNKAFPWINHPDASVELSVLPLAPVLNHMEAQGKKPFFFALNSSFIADDEYLKSVTQTDEVIMIGYPGGLWDNVNNQPIFRKGVLATSPSKKFQGRREFLIDMPVYCGSSGSPVLLYSEGVYFDRERGVGGHGLIAGSRLKLLGINYATYTATVTGQIVPIPIPTVMESGAEMTDSENGGIATTAEQRVSLAAKMGVPNNLGIIIQASRLKEIEEMFANILRSLPSKEAQ